MKHTDYRVNFCPGPSWPGAFSIFHFWRDRSRFGLSSILSRVGEISQSNPLRFEVVGNERKIASVGTGPNFGLSAPDISGQGGGKFRPPLGTKSDPPALYKFRTAFVRILYEGHTKFVRGAGNFQYPPIPPPVAPLCHPGAGWCLRCRKVQWESGRSFLARPGSGS